VTDQLDLALPVPPRTGKAWAADLAGEDGNAFVILANVGRIIRDTLGKEVETEYLTRARSGNYENLLAVTNEYVTLISSPRYVVYDLSEGDQECGS
jgi:hypothetical protein